MRKLAFVLLAGVSFGAVGVANAADLPRHMPRKAPPARVYAPVPFTWSGFYVGANAGWGWTSGDGTVTAAGATGPISGSGNGFLGGVQAGYNWQMGALVVGLETDFQGSAIRNDVNFSTAGVTGTGTEKNPWFGTIRGRLGYAQDRWLFYVTGGGLYGKNTLDGTLSTTGPFSSSATYWTWVAGAGVEAKLWDRWSAKLEYLYAGKPDNQPGIPGATDVSRDQHTDIVRVGLNYHF